MPDAPKPLDYATPDPPKPVPVDVIATVIVGTFFGGTMLLAFAALLASLFGFLRAW